MKQANDLNSESLIRITRYLMLYASSISNPGLLNGKMGIVLFFYELGRYTRKKIYDNFAGELLDEVCIEINESTPINFRDGLCGIGWGIEYLIRNGFVEAGTDEILEELDKRIIETDVRRMGDNSLETGLKGVASYVISRRWNRLNENPFIGRDYVADLIDALKKNENRDEENLLLINDLEKILRKETIIQPYNPILKIINNTKYRIKSIFEKQPSLGICKNGLAGIGLQLMKIHIP
ncbi:MAG: hypothetical protein LBK94_00440 [Prevotellaceae bacterium]|jgi:lantibiotic modifying enzyme|nr:hypothetical protein [Prevotellaceae bacterium]